MRFFDLLGLQHFAMYLLPGLVFIIIFGLFLGYSHFASDRAEESKKTIIYRFPGGFEDRNAPFPLAMALVIAGTVLWGLFYILGVGIFKVVI
jgi:hypothetical protein